MLKLYIMQLVAKARSGSDPGIYADLIIDNMPDKDIDALISGNWFEERILLHVPGAGDVKPWFEELYIMLRDRHLTGEAEPATVSAGEGSGDGGA